MSRTASIKFMSMRTVINEIRKYDLRMGVATILRNNFFDRFSIIPGFRNRRLAIGKCIGEFLVALTPRDDPYGGDLELVAHIIGGRDRVEGHSAPVNAFERFARVGGDSREVSKNL